MGERDLVIGYESALAFWRRARVGATPEPAGDDAGGRVYGTRRLTLSERARRGIEVCSCDGPLDVVRAGSGPRHNNKLIADHIWRGPIADQHLVSVGDGLWVCRAPLALAQLGASTDVVELAELAYELVGSYAVVPGSASGTVGDLEPLTSLEELRGYAADAAALGVRCADRVLDALDLVVPGSRSVRESDIGIMLSLSRVRGGALMRGFSLNAPISLPRSLAATIGQRRIIPDFSWPCGTVVEYDSTRWHQSPEARARDERKRRAYKQEGLDYLTLTRGILGSDAELDQFLEDLEQSLGIKRRAPSERMLSARHALRARLFGPELTEAALLHLNNGVG
ncbi:hypothetical protein [Thermophilibacter sp.]